MPVKAVTTFQFVKNNDEKRIFSFLKENSSSFIPPLEGRVDIAERAGKLVARAHNFFIFLNKEDIAHAAFYLSAEDRCFITSFCVRSTHLRRGYGASLMKHIIDLVGQSKGQSIELEVFRLNTNAINFYLSNGFSERFSTRDKILMVKDLSSLGPQTN